MPRRTAVGFAVVLLLGGLIGFAVGFIFYTRDTRLATHGVHAVATVIAARQHDRGQHTSHASQSNITYSLDIAFPLAKGSQRADLPCTYMAYLTHKAGDTVEVVYNPQNSQEVQLGGSLNDRSDWGIMIVSGLAVLVGTMLLILIASSKGQDQFDPDDVDALT